MISDEKATTVHQKRRTEKHLASNAKPAPGGSRFAKPAAGRSKAGFFLTCTLRTRKWAEPWRVDRDTSTFILEAERAVRTHVRQPL